MKKLVAIFIALILLTLVVVACGSGNSGGATSGGGSYTVHLSDQNFAQASITVNKDSSITLANDSAAPHIIANGSWVNGSVQPMQESGAPSANDLQVSGNGSQIIGPFNTVGTFHYYCTVHPGMSLTVIVQ